MDNLIFPSIDAVRSVVPAARDLTLDTLATHIQGAQTFLTRFVGPAQTTAIIAAANSTTNPAPVAALLYPARRVIGNLAMLRQVGTGNVLVSEAGVHRTNTGSQGDAFQWQVESLKRQLETDAWEALETLLTLLDDNATSYPAYTGWSGYPVASQSLIRSAASFSECYFIADSRLTFWAISPALRAAESARIRPTLTDSVHDTLIANQGLTPAESLARIHARRALAYATMSRALRERLVEIGLNGVQVRAISNFGNINTETPADPRRTDQLLAYLDAECSAELSRATALLRVPGPVSAAGGPRGNKIVSF